MEQRFHGKSNSLAGKGFHEEVSEGILNHSNVDNFITIYLITSCEEPAAAWTSLRDHFERDTLVNTLMLKK